jgi:prophage antirepressor-like protein
MSKGLPANSQGTIIVFGARQIRRTWHDEQWFFSVVDIIGALTDSPNPRDYWYRMKRREKESSDVELSTLCRQLKLTSADGKSYMTEVVNTESAFRIIQSIPSPKAEPFKRWLAQVGYQRVQEIENPELAQQRMVELYKQKGYPADWIDKRVRSIAIRDELTDEWKQRGINERKDFAILTAEISKATFGLTPTQYKDLKGLDRENLRDHMTDLELIFTMLGEAATTEIARTRDAQGFAPNKAAARDGGTIAGNARRQLEHKSGKRVVTRQNYLMDKPRPSLPSGDHNGS